MNRQTGTYTFFEPPINVKNDTLTEFISGMTFIPHACGYQCNDPQAICGDRITGDFELIYIISGMRRGYEVYIGKVGNTEVDFIAIGDVGEEYYQVAYTVIDAEGKTLKRELAPLEAISDHNPKYLLTMDHTPFMSHNGIKQINVLDWLLK